MRVDDDQRWTAFRVALNVPRQNGKNAILEAYELAALVLLPRIFGIRQRVTHSAHLFPTAREHFLRMQELVESNSDVRKLVKSIQTANGNEQIVMVDKSRLKFIARSKSAGRGPSVDLMVLDEAYDLPDTVMGALIPSMAAKPRPQVWFTSSAPHSSSITFHSIRSEAQSETPGRLAYFEWGNEADVDLLDKEAWYRANPGLGIRITEQFVEDEYRALKVATTPEFARERLGVAETPDMFAGKLDFASWRACERRDSTVDRPGAIALDVSPERSWASFAVAGHTEDDRVHVEVVDRREGTAWVTARAAELAERWSLPIVVDPRSPAGGCLDELVSAGVEVVEFGGLEITRGCAGFQDAVLNGRLVHIGQGPLDAAVAGASTRTVGESWAWSRVSSQVDISPLVACTFAFAACGDPARNELVYAY